MADKTLHDGDYISVILRDGWYEMYHENKGDQIAVVGYRHKEHGGINVLIRNELNVAHSPNKEYNCLTGTMEGNEDTVIGRKMEACRELREESGYSASPEELIEIGGFFNSKASDHLVWLYVVDLTNKPRSEAVGDGTKGEEGASCVWGTPESVLELNDPFIQLGMFHIYKSLGLVV